MRLIKNLQQNLSSKEVGSFQLFCKKNGQFKQWSISIAILAFLLTFSNTLLAQCPPAGSTFWFANPNDGIPIDGSQPLGSYDNPLTDWNSGTPSVLEAITDCPGPIVVNLRSCYYNTDGTDGDVNWVQENLQDNVTINGNGALLENLSASSKWLVIGNHDNWVINDVTLTGYNGTDGAAIGIYASTNVVLNNVEFNGNPTTTALHIDAGDNFTYNYGDASVVINDCLFANNPPGAETVSTGALEIQNISSGNHIVDVDINNTVFSCNKRAGYGGAIVSTNSENSPGATINLDIIGCTFSNNLAFGTAGEGGGLYASGEEHFINIDNTVFTCNEAQATTGTGSGGGAIRIWDGPNVIISNSIFYGNIASTTSGDGGAIAYSAAGPTGPFTITNSSFINNTSANGGGIWADELITLTGGFFSGNTPDDISGGGVTDTDGGASNTTGDPGITACNACPALPSIGCDASGSDLALTCPYFCSTGTPPNATGDADLTIDMTNFVVPTCTEPLDYTYVFLAVDAAGNVVCEFPATDATTQDPLNGFVTIAGPADGIPDAMDPAVQQANLCAGLATGDYTLVGFHYLTADVPPIVTPFVGQTLTQIADYLTNPPTDPVACGVIGTAVPFTILEPIEVTITTSCPAVPDGTYLADITVTGGYPLEAGAGAYTLTTNFGVSTYTFGTPITGQVIPAGQSVDVTVAADGNGANGTSPPGPLCFDCMATIVSEPEPACQACPDIVDGTLSAEVNAAPATDVCSGDVISVCVEVDLTNDPTATVEFSNDGGATWLPGVATSATEYCLDFTETNATCDAVAVSYMAQFTMSSLADMTCSLDTQPITGGATVTVNVYPDVAAVANAMIANDGTCGPSLTQDCANFTVTNTYDGNGATPDFSAETGAGSFDFVITNTGAPMACESVTLPATYSCATCDIMIANVAVDCAGGDGTATITVTATGGSGVYDYSIDNGATWQASNVFGPLINSTYTIIVRDNADTACLDMLVDLVVSCNAPAVPDITIDKDDNDNIDDMQTVSTGDDAVFTITVTNTGDEDLCNVIVTDTNGATCDATYTDNGGTLVVGDTWTYTCTVPNTSGGYVNNAVVTADGCTSGTPVTDDDDSTVFVDDPTTTTPDVTVDKNDADNGDDMQIVSTGDDAIFTITVSNTGDEDLCNVIVTDANGAACEATYTDNGGILVIGGTWTYTCTVPNTLGGYVNTAVVTAEGCTSGTPTGDADDSTVFVDDPVTTTPDVTVDKNDADNGDDAQTVSTGDDAVFTITVTNTGDEDLCNVIVTDANGAACEATYTDNAGILVIGGTWTYQCTVPNTLNGYVNTAVVTAEGCTSGTSTGDEDASCVNVADPVLDALKTSDFTDANGDGLLNPGEIITYTIVLTNYGTADAINVMFSDAVPAGTTLLGNETTTLGTISAGTDPVTANLGTLTANGGTATITFEVTVDDNTADGFIIMNQGTFTSDNHSDVPTDDPTTPTTPDDPTEDPVVDPSCIDADNGTWNH